MDGQIKSKLGLLHLYIGDGKGKTTAAVGLCVRAAGAGLRTVLFQFLKGQNSGELASLAQLGIPVHRTDEVKKFIPYMEPQELDACKKSHNACFALAKQALAGGEYDLIAMDEVLDAVATGMVDEQELLAALKGRAANTEVVLTGRGPCDELRALADYISDVQAVKHPYTKGVAARYGIEY